MAVNSASFRGSRTIGFEPPGVGVCPPQQPVIRRPPDTFCAAAPLPRLQASLTGQPHHLASLAVLAGADPVSPPNDFNLLAWPVWAIVAGGGIVVGILLLLYRQDARYEKARKLVNDLGAATPKVREEAIRKLEDLFPRLSQERRLKVAKKILNQMTAKSDHHHSDEDLSVMLSIVSHLAREEDQLEILMPYFKRDLEQIQADIQSARKETLDLLSRKGNGLGGKIN